ncbi:hypothetical protein [Streptomyces sp. NPDC058291]|uniref:hypothetical protein n=1 Tax=Streptomyces sp. NPDC058291 TaxID=3346427 RepID=UPI0036F09E6A
MARKGVRPGEAHDVEEALDELYATPPSAFVPRREELAAAARTDGRAQDARRIHAARRPTLAAWAANLLLHARQQESRRFLELGRALRQAYGTLDAQGIRELTEQRRSIVSALSRQAAELAGEAGHRLSDAARQDVEATLRAVLADQDAADRWAAGRLENALTPPTDFPSAAGSRTGEPAGAAAAHPPPRSTRSSPSPKPPKPSKASRSRAEDELAERRRRRQEQADEARRAAEAADRRLGELRAEHANAETDLRRAQDREDRARERQATAERRLRQAEQDLRHRDEDLGRADQARQEAERGRRAAADAVSRAEQEARDAERKVRRLTGPSSGPG